MFDVAGNGYLFKNEKTARYRQQVIGDGNSTNDDRHNHPSIGNRNKDGDSNNACLSEGYQSL